MGKGSGIEWTGETWNPMTGCDQISAGCDNCYALTMARRLKGMGSPAYQNEGDPRTSGPGFRLTLQPDRLDQPLRWKRPRVVFVNSMSDMFHKDVPEDYIAQVFDVMRRADQHVFQVLTKRPKRMRNVLRQLSVQGEHVRWVNDHPVRHSLRHNPLPNVWLGTSVEDSRAEFRIEMLRQSPARVRFISAEPMIGPPSVGLDLRGIDWVIIGGESGARARPLELTWVRWWIYQAQEAGAKVFVKQLGKVYAEENGGPAKGGDPAYWPEDLNIRDLPDKRAAALLA